MWHGGVAVGLWPAINYCGPHQKSARSKGCIHKNVWRITCSCGTVSDISVLDSDVSADASRYLVTLDNGRVLGMILAKLQSIMDDEDHPTAMVVKALELNNLMLFLTPAKKVMLKVDGEYQQVYMVQKSNDIWRFFVRFSITFWRRRSSVSISLIFSQNGPSFLKTTYCSLPG